MSAVLTALRAELRRRRLQSLIIVLVILLSSGAGTLALSLLVESDAPYDHAFAQANGAHLTIMYDASLVDAARIAGTAHEHGVTAAAGPYLQVSAVLGANPRGAAGCAGCAPLLEGAFSLIGRDRPDPAVDRLTMESGRWARDPGEIVLSRNLADRWGLGVDDTVTLEGGKGTTLRVVGVAASVDGGAGAWVTPGQAPSLAIAGAPTRYQMFYRVTPAGSTSALAAEANTIAAGLPAGAVENVSNYLDVKRQADLLSAVMVPFLLAFSAFALLAAMFIIANVVGGVVVAGYREIGVMKAVGFTPGQVGASLLGQILAPTLGGCAIGIPLGTLVSQPFLQDTAHALNLPLPFTASILVDLGVLAATVLVAMSAAAIPCWRAGHLSAVTAMTRGSAPSTGRGARLGGYLSGLRLPRPIGLGLAEALVRPIRSLITMGAVLIGVATTVFALSLHLSLTQVAQHTIRDQYVQVDVQMDNRPIMSIKKQFVRPKPGDVPFGAGVPAPASDRQVTALLTANPATARFVAETQDQVFVPGISEPIPYYAYRGASDWIGYALTAGRWFEKPGEVVAPTKLIAETHLAIGQYFTAHMHGRAVRLRLVGEILDQTDDDLLLRGEWSTLAAVAPNMDIQPQTYEVGLKPGTDPDKYAQAIRQQSGGSVDPLTVRRSSDDTSFIMLNTVIAGLALILIVVAVAGVFNTVVLSTREKTRDIAILKAVGMEPRQVVLMVVSSVAFLGLAAGFLGIPAGIVLHRQVLQFMGQIASGTAIPPAFFDLIDRAELPLLALTGVAVAALGAWLPARWAAAGRVAEVLQAE
jgi:putative ABC transport system permease protein